MTRALLSRRFLSRDQVYAFGVDAIVLKPVLLYCLGSTEIPLDPTKYPNESKVVCRLADGANWLRNIKIIVLMVTLVPVNGVADSCSC